MDFWSLYGISLYLCLSRSLLLYYLFFHGQSFLALFHEYFFYVDPYDIYLYSPKTGRYEALSDPSVWQVRGLGGGGGNYGEFHKQAIYIIVLSSSFYLNTFIEAKVVRFVKGIRLHQESSNDKTMVAAYEPPKLG